MLMPNFMLTVNKPKGSRLDEPNLKKLQVSSSLKNPGGVLGLEVGWWVIFIGSASFRLNPQSLSSDWAKENWACPFSKVII